jgi:hypothetical protein
VFNEELHNLCYSPDIVMVIKSRTTTCEGHAARMKEMRNAYKICVEKRERPNEIYITW